MRCKCTLFCVMMCKTCTFVVIFNYYYRYLATFLSYWLLTVNCEHFSCGSVLTVRSVLTVLTVHYHK